MGSGKQFSNHSSELGKISEYHWRYKYFITQCYCDFFKQEKARNRDDLTEKFFRFISILRTPYLSLTDL